MPQNITARKCHLYLLRHAATEPNLAKLFVGRGDYPLAPAGRATALAARSVLRSILPCHLLFASPARRCQETAALIFPEFKPITLPALWERDLGPYEGKGLADLQDRADFQIWLDTEGAISPAGVEDRQVMRQRLAGAFAQIERYFDLLAADHEGDLHLILVVHGGVIVELEAVLRNAYGSTEKMRYDNMIGNAEIQVITLDISTKDYKFLGSQRLALGTDLRPDCGATAAGSAEAEQQTGERA